ncbi:hypothetical protein KCA24_22575 [Escherichia coli]|nr:hypothetical protein [Escherichia coli]
MGIVDTIKKPETFYKNDFVFQNKLKTGFKKNPTEKVFFLKFLETPEHPKSNASAIL